VFSTEDSIT